MRIKILDEQPLELEFQDGTKMTALFNNMAFVMLNQEFGEGENKMIDINKLIDLDNPFPGMSKILYCGLKQCHPQVTLEEAESILYRGGMDLVMSISELMFSNFNITSNEETKKKFMAMLTPEQKQALKEVNLL